MPAASPVPNVAQSVKDRIFHRAGELQFDDCRFTAANPPESAAHLQAWLAKGDHGEMHYLARNAEKRADLQKVLPGARTVISLATGYHSPHTPDALRSHAPPFSGIIARYARFNDYHKVINERLKELTRFISALQPGTKSLWYVDTGPILERDLAQRAGLGFIGKHTNLISRRLGNWIFLSEIITTLE